MTLILNIRGTNGSGKTTLVRSFLPPNMDGDALGGPVDLCRYAAPTKKDPGRKLSVTGYLREDPEVGRIGVVGPYKTATGGLDCVPSFDIQQSAITFMGMRFTPAFILAEGVLASTVFGSWATFADRVNTSGSNNRFAFCYLSTPLEECLFRIGLRQKASGKEREIKEDLVADKVKAIAATRKRALEAGHLVFDLPYEDARKAVWDIMRGNEEPYRARL